MATNHIPDVDLLLDSCLVSALEASLQCSIAALLALDVAALEAESRKQMGLVREWTAMKSKQGLGLSEAGPQEKAKIRRVSNRIIELVRLQSALLTRMHGKMRVLANMQRGTSAIYGRPTTYWGLQNGSGRI